MLFSAHNYPGLFLLLMSVPVCSSWHTAQGQAESSVAILLLVTRLTVRRKLGLRSRLSACLHTFLLSALSEMSFLCLLLSNKVFSPSGFFQNIFCDFLKFKLTGTGVVFGPLSWLDKFDASWIWLVFAVDLWKFQFIVDSDFSLFLLKFSLHMYYTFCTWHTILG
jgi:hypothetical protein